MSQTIELITLPATEIKTLIADAIATGIERGVKLASVELDLPAKECATALGWGLSKFYEMRESLNIKPSRHVGSTPVYHPSAFVKALTASATH